MLFSSVVHVQILRSSGWETVCYVFVFSSCWEIGLILKASFDPITFQVPTDGIKVERKGIYSFKALYHREDTCNSVQLSMYSFWDIQVYQSLGNAKLVSDYISEHKFSSCLEKKGSKKKMKTPQMSCQCQSGVSLDDHLRLVIRFNFSCKSPETSRFRKLWTYVWNYIYIFLSCYSELGIILKTESSERSDHISGA